MKKNLVIIGFGGMGGGFHYRNASVSDAVNLLGIYDIDPAKKEKARNLGVFAYDSLEDVLSDERIDLVTVAIPNDVHLPTVLACLNAGKNVICEKPVALSSSDLQQMIDAANKNKVRFTVHQNRRWDVDFLAMKQLFDEGTIGDVFNIESRIHGSRGIPGDWRGEAAHGGGMLLDWGVHLIDQIFMIYPGRVTSLYCTFSHLTNKEVDDGFKLRLFFDDGREAYVEVGTLNFIPMPRFYMQGMKGTARLDDWQQKTKVTICRHWHESEVVPVQTAAGLTKTMAPRDSVTTDEFELERPSSDVHDFYRNFCAAIDGREEQLIRHDQVMRTMKIMEAAFESVRTGQVIQYTE